MKTKLIFLITVATFSVHAFAMQHSKDRQIQFQMQTRIRIDQFNFFPPDSIVIAEQDSVAEIEIQTDDKAILCIGGGSDAEYPGGMVAFGQYFMQNLVINQSDSSQVKAGCQTVWVKFTIDEKGEVIDPLVVKSAGNELDNAVLKVFKTMPRWIPAVFKDENISTNYTLPIQIYLN
jgi:TonB family protein